MRQILIIILKIPLYLVRAYFTGCLNTGLFALEVAITLLVISLHYTTPGGIEQNYYGMAIGGFGFIVWAFHLLMMVPNLLSKNTYR